MMCPKQVHRDLKYTTSGQGWGETKFPYRKDILKWSMVVVIQATK